MSLNASRRVRIAAEEFAKRAIRRAGIGSGIEVSNTRAVFGDSEMRLPKGTCKTAVKAAIAALTARKTAKRREVPNRRAGRRAVPAVLIRRKAA